MNKRKSLDISLKHKVKSDNFPGIFNKFNFVQMWFSKNKFYNSLHVSVLMNFVRTFLGSSIDGCEDTGIAKRDSKKGGSNFDPSSTLFAVQIILWEGIESWLRNSGSTVETERNLGEKYHSSKTAAFVVADDCQFDICSPEIWRLK